MIFHGGQGIGHHVWNHICLMLNYISDISLSVENCIAKGNYNLYPLRIKKNEPLCIPETKGHVANMCFNAFLSCFLCFHDLVFGIRCNSCFLQAWTWEKGVAFFYSGFGVLSVCTTIDLIEDSNLAAKLNGTLPTDPKWGARVIRYSGLGVRSVGPVGDFLESWFL